MNKRMMTLALAAAVTMVAVPAMAQDNFPDVPENHWAFEAIENLKREGILVGYPDGTYKGPRATTRYELAVALNAAYQRLKNITDGLAEQIAEIRRNMGTGSDKGLADRLAAVEAQLKGMSSLADDVAAMKRMAGEFQKELASQGVDVEAMKKDLDAMKKNMGGGTEPSVKISGDANIIVHAGVGEDGELTYGIDGRFLGWDEQRNQTTNSILGDMNVYHEIALNLDGNVSGGTKWGATMVYGNLLGEGASLNTLTGSSFVVQGYGNQSGRFQGTAFGEGAGDFYISRLVVDLSDSLPFSIKAGRFGVQSDNPYIYKRADNSPYFDNDRWDNGGWIFDGASVDFKFGETVGLTVAAGRNDQRQSNGGLEINPISLGSVGVTDSADSVAIVQNSLLTQLKFGLTDKGSVSLNYNWHGLNAAGEGATSGDRLEVLGAFLNFGLADNMKLQAGYGQSVLKFESNELVDEDNVAWFGSLDYMGNNFGLNLGFRRIEENYLAPGDWERIGTFWSPRGVEDFQVGGHFNLGNNTKLSARALIGEFIDSDEYTSLKADVSFGFGGGWSGMLGAEFVDFEDEIEQRWYTLGVNRQLGNNGMFKLIYQYADHKIVDNDARGFFGFNGGKGHILFGQVTVKF